MPSSRVLHELDENIQRYKGDDLLEKDLAELAYCTAVQTTENLTRLITAAKESNEKFSLEVKNLARIARKERRDEQLEATKIVGEALHDLREAEEDHAERIAEQCKQSAETIILGLKENLKNIQKAIKPLKNIYDSLSKQAHREVKKTYISTGVGVLVLVILIIYIMESLQWKTVSTLINCILSLSPIIIACFYNVITKKNFSLTEIIKKSTEKKKEGLIIKNNFDTKALESLQEREHDLNKEISNHD